MAEHAYVGLSGGVDSAVSAALLVREGLAVTGVFIKIWQPEFIECTWEKDRIDAMRVAVALDIPFREIDLSEEYKREVVAEMLAAYRAGTTPNPDVTCNERIKFGSFYEWARAQGADVVATGHYARIEGEGRASKLLRGSDTEKDQSYFLHRIDREVLPHVRFPIGTMKKPEVRALAKKLRLPVAHKHDSQGLCFVGDVSIKDFIRRYIPVSPGKVFDTKGAVVGEHDGATLYTVGQRHGFTVRASADTERAHYIVNIDPQANSIVVSSDKVDTESRAALLDEPHWLQDVQMPQSLSVQTRYRERPFTAAVSLGEGGLRADFDAPHTISPGQSMVFYQGDECLGGARIRRL